MSEYRPDFAAAQDEVSSAHLWAEHINQEIKDGIAHEARYAKVRAMSRLQMGRMLFDWDFYARPGQRARVRQRTLHATRVA